MALLSLGENKWRMVRRAFPLKTFTFTEARNDRGHFDWMVENEFFVEVGAGKNELTAKDRASADFGLYEWEPAVQAPPTKRPKKTR